MKGTQITEGGTPDIPIFEAAKDKNRVTVAPMSAAGMTIVSITVKNR